MRVNILYFASIRESLGIGSEVIQTQAKNVEELRLELIGKGEPYAEALSLNRVLKTALNQEMCTPNTQLMEGCELAFFPPVTGG